MSQLTTTTPTGVTGYQFNCNKTAACTHTAVGSGGWHTILCVQFHSIPLSGNRISCFMQLHKAVCILIHLLPLHLFPSLFLLSLPDVGILATSCVQNVGCDGEWGRMGGCCVLQSSGSQCHFSMQCLVHLYLNTLLSKLPTEWYTFVYPLDMDSLTSMT